MWSAKNNSTTPLFLLSVFVCMICTLYMDSPIASMWSYRVTSVPHTNLTRSLCLHTFKNIKEYIYIHTTTTTSRKCQGKLQKTCRKLARHMQETDRKHIGHMQEPSRDLAQNIQKTCQKYVSNFMQETSREPAGNTQENTGHLQETCRKPA